ncbi:hypothetical protein OAL58_01140 [Verrucomicrobia bacterium]|nr:hypothetical protein [Verrucomicrobiota bacterium]
MRNDISFILTKLTVLALVAVLAGCGGGEGGGSDQNQSSTQKPDNSDGGQAAKVPESPKATKKTAEKFTPEMVKAATEAALSKLPNLRTTKEERVRMMESEAIQGLTDKLNKNISDGKIDHRGLKVDAITIEALTEAFMGELPKAQKRRDATLAVYNAKRLFQSITSYSDSDEGKLPVADKWCDAILQEVGTLAVFLSPQHPDTAKLKAALPNGGALKEPRPNDDAISPPKNDDGAAPAPKEAAKRKPLQKKARHSHYAFNKAMAGQAWGVNNGEPVLVFECDLGWNGAGGLADALKYMDKFKLEKIAVSSGDGFARAVTREELKKLKWEIAP